MKFISRDNIHYSFRAIDGQRKPFNFVVSSRDSGKSTGAILDKIYSPWIDEGKCAIILRRRIVDITDIYIRSLEEVINKFTPPPEKHIIYNKSTTKEGAVRLMLQTGDDKPQLFAVIVALSCQAGRLKSLVVPNPSNMIFDEFIVNTRDFREKYLSAEAARFREIYTTFERESKTPLKCYFLGNPYSLYNPYFAWLDVPTSKLKKGVTLTGVNWAVECYQLSDALAASILARNPLYQIDDEYKQYAFDGSAVNDAEIPLGSRPNGAWLAFTVRLGSKGLALYRTPPNDLEHIYYAEVINLADISANRTIWIVDLDDLTRNSVLFSHIDKFRFQRFAEAIRYNKMLYKDIEAYYLSKEVYEQL